MKQFKFVAFIMLALTFAIGFTACGDDDDEPQSALVGTWDSPDGGVRYVFNSGGSGSETYNRGTSYISTTSFRWVATGSVLSLTKTVQSSSGNYDDTYNFYYSIEGNVLTMFYDDWDLKGTYIKQ